MYNRLWGNMNANKHLLVIGILLSSLYGCSMLGDRKESTKLDIDHNELPQIKVLKSKSSSDKQDDATDSDKNAKIDLDKTVDFRSKYLHASMDAEKIVEEKKIGLIHLMQGEVNGEKKHLPAGFDSAMIVFGLGTEIQGNLNIIDNPSDDLKASIGYTEAGADAKKQELIQKNPECEDRIYETTAQGLSNFNLSKTQIDQLAKNTVINDSGKTLSDEVTGEIKKELSKDTLDVTEYVFGNLPKDTQKTIRALFKPDLGLLVFEETKNFTTCLLPNKTAMAYVLDQNGYVFIPQKQIQVEWVDGNYQITFNVIRDNVTVQDLNKITLMLKGQEDVKVPMGQLKIGDNGISVFQEPHKQVSTFKFRMKGPDQASAPASDQEQTSSPTTQTTPPSTDQQPTVDQQTIPPTDLAPISSKNTTTKNDSVPTLSDPTVIPVVTPATNKTIEKTNPPSNVQGKKTTSAPSTPARSTATSSNQTGPISGRDDNDETPKPSVPVHLKPDSVNKDSAKTQPPANLVSTEAPIVRKYEKSNSPWYNTKHNGYEENFYKYDSEKKVFAYQPNGMNENIWDDSAFKGNIPFTDQEVRTKCSGYEYIRNMTFKTELERPAEFDQTNYISNGQFTKSYQTVLFDQLYPEIGYKDVTKDMVLATTTPPHGAKTQIWEIKLCFDSQKNFLAFWSATETRSTNFVLGDSSSVQFTGDNPKHWYKMALQDQFIAGKKPVGFNPYRKALSSMDIEQNPVTKKYAIRYQLGFKRSIPARMLMAYINQKYIAGTKEVAGGLVKVGPEKVLKGIEEGFSNGPGRTETFVYGGFEFDPTVKGETTAQILSPQQMQLYGYTKAQDYIPPSSGYIFFPGETNALNLVVKLLSSVGNSARN